MSATTPEAPAAVVRPKIRKRVKSPTILQMEAVECGAASLAMILAHHGLFLSLPELRVACGVSRDGSKAANVLKAARAFGLEAKGYKKELAGLFELEPPFVVFWHFNHFLVVDGWDRHGVWLNDPGGGRRRVEYEEFDQGFTGVVLIFKPGPAFKKGGQPPTLWPAVKDRAASSVPTVAFCALAGLLLTAPSLAVPVFTQVFIDSVLVKGYTDWLTPVIAGMAMVALLTAGLRFLELIALMRLGISMSVAQTGRFFWHTLRLPAGFYAQRYAGEIAGRVWLNESVAHAMSGPLATTTIDVVMALMYLGAMVAYDPVLAGIALVLVAANFALTYRINTSMAEAYQKITIEGGKAEGVTISGLQTIETLKASGLEGDFFARWAGYYAKSLNARQKLATRSQLLGALPALLSALTGLAVLVLGGYRVMDGVMSIGMLIGFQSLMGMFMEPAGRLIGLGTQVTEMQAQVNRLDDVLNHGLSPTVAEGPPAKASDPVRLGGHIELRDVTFGFSQHEAPLIEGLSLTLKPGQRVALVGGSGSGKSTVARLIVGLYTPWSGQVLFDGRPRATLPREVIAGSLAMVDQDLFMFAGPVRDNLTLWDATIGDKDLMEACRDADVLDVIARMPGGLDAELTEGAANLSGGQRQRIEIARALARDPAILVLDEATSALDSESERIVDANLRRRGCTCIIIAHRLSTIRDCDEIIVFHRGKVSQRGTHDQLKAQEGHYARLIAAEGGAVKEVPV